MQPITYVVYLNDGNGATLLRDECLPRVWCQGNSVYPLVKVVSYTGPDYALSIATDMLPEYAGKLSVREYWREPENIS